MVPKVERLKQLDALVLIGRVILTQASQNTNFDLTRISVLLHSSNYFYGDEFVQFAVITLHNFAERALTQQLLDLVSRSDEFTFSDNNVSVSVV